MERQANGCLSAILRLMGIRPDWDKDSHLPYRTRSSVLTNAEHAFYLALLEAVGDRAKIFPKIGLQDVFYIIDRERYQTARNRIVQRHIDFLLCNPKTLQPLFGIELDDSSHNQEKAKRRDEFKNKVFESAFLPLLRFPVQVNFNSDTIKERLEPYFVREKEKQELEAPRCPVHEIPMVIKTAQRGAYKGRSFYACPKFPDCKEKIDIPADETYSKPALL